MPLDYLALKNQGNKRVNDLLAGQPQVNEDYLNGARQRIEAARNNNLGDALSSNLAGVSSQYGLGGISADPSPIKRNLDSNLNMNLANQRFNLNSQNYGNILNQKNNQVQDSQNVLGMQKNFSQATANQNIAQAQQAKMADIQRQQQLKMAQLGIDNANQTQGLQNQYLTPQVDYQSSLMRVLTGLPVQIGLGTYLNNKSIGNSNYANPNTGAGYNQPQVFGPQQQQYGPYNPWSQ